MDTPFSYTTRFRSRADRVAIDGFRIHHPALVQDEFGLLGNAACDCFRTVDFTGEQRATHTLARDDSQQARPAGSVCALFGLGQHLIDTVGTAADILAACHRDVTEREEVAEHGSTEERRGGQECCRTVRTRLAPAD